ncbi:HAMP domain-containing histidine kinase [Agromyces atrinae]|uniref:sensor histidine kinase n=1 Tax=Agromyces atrinae TaxID=592376 RepID=UPI001F5AB73D|nr:HAMP domain-containing sensor histidine kinase [Agromyces atrinae]MCI2957740.1 HAMP domain-containing histidine kinase [Agromyces atrinae]
MAGEGIGRTGVRGERRGAAVRSIDQSVMLTQLLFGFVTVVVVFLSYAIGVTVGSIVLFFAAFIGVFAGCVLAVAVPWHRFPSVMIVILPIIDIIAIGTLRIGLPDAGVGLLWAFPIIWLSTYFSLAALVTGLATAFGFVVATFAIAKNPPTVASVSSVSVLVLVLTFIGISGFLNARRSRAQRRLLRKQTIQLEDALRRARQQERLVAEVLNAVDFGVIRFGRDGEITVTNEAHARMQAAIAAPGEWPAVYAADAETLLPTERMPIARAQAGEEFDNEIVWAGEPGSPNRRALSITSRLLTDEHGAPEGSIVVSNDVTAELKALKARDDLVASVSHELRTPLTSILGYVDLALGDDLPPETTAKLEIVERNSSRLLELIGDIIVANRDGDANLVLRPTDSDIGAIVEASAESLEPRAKERDVTVHIDTVEHVHATIDPARVRQIIDNLLSNAIKYNRDGGDVYLGVTGDESWVWVVVRDTGIGISDVELPRLFDRFFRSESVRNSTIHGSGLGLGITRDIVRKHGGDLTVHSVVDEGTTVVVKIPKEAPQ